ARLDRHPVAQEYLGRRLGRIAPDRTRDTEGGARRDQTQQSERGSRRSRSHWISRAQATDGVHEYAGERRHISVRGRMVGAYGVRARAVKQKSGRQPRRYSGGGSEPGAPLAAGTVPPSASRCALTISRSSVVGYFSSSWV